MLILLFIGLTNAWTVFHKIHALQFLFFEYRIGVGLCYSRIARDNCPDTGRDAEHHNARQQYSVIHFYFFIIRKTNVLDLSL